MMGMLFTRNGFAILSVSAALVFEIGCNSDRSTSRIEPEGVPTARELKDLANEVSKDVKPPVIINPSSPLKTGPGETQPKPESK
jgi:hypothetical protein